MDTDNYLSLSLIFIGVRMDDIHPPHFAGTFYKIWDNKKWIMFPHSRWNQRKRKKGGRGWGNMNLTDEGQQINGSTNIKQ